MNPKIAGWQEKAAERDTYEPFTLEWAALLAWEIEKGKPFDFAPWKLWCRNLGREGAGGRGVGGHQHTGWPFTAGVVQDEEVIFLSPGLGRGVLHFEGQAGSACPKEGWVPVRGWTVDAVRPKPPPPVVSGPQASEPLVAQPDGKAVEDRGVQTVECVCRLAPEPSPEPVVRVETPVEEPKPLVEKIRYTEPYLREFGFQGFGGLPVELLSMESYAILYPEVYAATKSRGYPELFRWFTPDTMEGHMAGSTGEGWLFVETRHRREPLKDWEMVEADDDFVPDYHLVESGDHDDVWMSEWECIPPEELEVDSLPSVRLSVGFEAPPVTHENIGQSYWWKSRTEESSIAPVVCVDALGPVVRLLSLFDRVVRGRSTTAVELRPEALRSIGLCPGDIVYYRCRGDHALGCRQQAGGATNLTEVHSLVCKEGEMRIVDQRRVRIADGRQYEIGRLEITAARPGLGKFLARAGLCGFNFVRLALTPAEDTPLCRQSLDALPSELAKVRFQYTAMTPLLPLEMQGPYRDILSEHVAQERPAAFDAVKIGREVAQYHRTIQNMGGRTLPVTLQ